MIRQRRIHIIINLCEIVWCVDAYVTIDDKAQDYWVGKLGKKKNEHKEVMIKQERERSRLKNKEPKQEFIVDLGERKNKTAGTGRNGGKSSALSSESSLEDVFNGREHSENAGKTRESEDVANEIPESEKVPSAKSEW